MNATLYLRKSNAEGDKDVNAKSIEVQRDVATRFATSKGLTVVSSYTDDAETGALYDRPGLVALLADAKAKDRAFDAVIVTNQDRIGRGGIHETLLVIAELEKAGIQIWSADGREISTAGDDTGMRELMN